MIDSIRRKWLVASAATLLAAAIPLIAQANGDAAIGTWKLNVAKSTFKPGPAPKSMTVKFEADGATKVKTTTDVVPASGDAQKIVYAAAYDGKDYPMTGSAAADTVSLKPLDAKRLQRVDKAGGKVVYTYVRTIEGATMKVTQKGTNPKGEPVDNAYHFERQ